MSKNVVYAAFGEEAARGTAQKTVANLGYIPMREAVVPEFVPEDKPRKEMRGEDTYKGAQVYQRMHRSWTGSPSLNFFTEAGGTAKGMIATIFKHFFGKVTSTQFGATDAYAHMYSPEPDPFISGAIGAKALTFNANLNEENTMRNWPFVGGRLKGLTFEQEQKDHLVVTLDMMGQYREASEVEVGSDLYPDENLRCDYNNLTLYTGTITRTGVAPNYTDISAPSGTALAPDKVSIKMTNGFEDMTRCNGVDYPDLTRLGAEFEVEIEITIDWRTSGFDSVAEFNAWVTAASSTNFTFIWDTGTEAGTSENHRLIIDIPKAQRMGGQPEYDVEKDPMVTLKYTATYDLTTLYKAGVLLVNSATAA